MKEGGGREEKKGGRLISLLETANSYRQERTDKEYSPPLSCPFLHSQVKRWPLSDKFPLASTSKEKRTKDKIRKVELIMFFNSVKIRVGVIVSLDMHQSLNFSRQIKCRRYR